MSAAIDPPATGLPISVAISTDKEHYIRCEPIRFFVWAQLNGPAQTLTHTDDVDPLRIVLERKDRTGIFVKIKDVQLDHSWPPLEFAHCGTGHVEREVETSLNRILPGYSEYWLDEAWPIGGHHVRASLKVVSGPRTGEVVHSNEILVSIVAPAETDREACEFLAGRHSIQMAGRIINIDAAPLRFLSPHDGRDLALHFLERFGETTYAHYARTLMPSDPGRESPDEFCGRMETVIAASPTDFPLRLRAYLGAIACRDGWCEYDQVYALVNRARSERVRSINRFESEEFEKVAAAIAWWPPDTPEEMERVATGQRSRRQRDAALSHWLTRSLIKEGGWIAYPRLDNRGGISLTLLSPSRPSYLSGGRINLRFLFDEESQVPTVELHGTLDCFLVSALAEPLKQALSAHKIPDTNLRSHECIATLRNSTLAGVFQFGSEAKPFEATVSPVPPQAQKFQE